MTTNAHSQDSLYPDWTIRKFLVLENGERWTPAISRQLKESVKAANIPISVGVERVPDVRSLLKQSQQATTPGVILFLESRERECVTAISRISQLTSHPFVLAVGSGKHQELLPVLLESGICTPLFDIVNDVPVVEWCIKVVRSRSALSSADAKS